MPEKRRLPWAFIFSDEERSPIDRWGRVAFGRLWFRIRNWGTWLRRHWRSALMVGVPVLVLLLAVGVGRLSLSRLAPKPGPGLSLPGLKTTGRAVVDGPSAKTERVKTTGETEETVLPHTRLLRPVQGKISTGPGWRKHPLLGDWRYHSGLDWLAPSGSLLYAVLDGTVSTLRLAGGDEDVEPGGWEMIIRHADGWESVYLFGGEPVVREGDKVRRGAVVARLSPAAVPASGGEAVLPSLHFELRREGKVVDPRPWLE